MSKLLDCGFCGKKVDVVRKIDYEKSTEEKIVTKDTNFIKNSRGIFCNNDCSSEHLKDTLRPIKEKKKRKSTSEKRTIQNNSRES